MDLVDAVLILIAGAAAGTINSIVGSGTLITFPTLLALGYPPVVANVSNTVGLVPGSFAGAWGYRRELDGQRGRLTRFAIGSTLGGVTGAALLLVLPEDAFDTIVPALIGLAVILVIIQPWISRKLASRPDRHAHGGPWLMVGIVLTGVYGGYFGAAQGVILIAVMATALTDPLQRLNAMKNVLAGLVNLVAALLFIVVAEVDWAVAGLIACGAVGGGFLGSVVGRLLPPVVLRALIVVIGSVAVLVLVM